MELIEESEINGMKRERAAGQRLNPTNNANSFPN